MSKEVTSEELFNVGDVVSLKSKQGPRMVILSRRAILWFLEGPLDNRVHVGWFDIDNHFCVEDINILCLEKAQPYSD